MSDFNPPPIEDFNNDGGPVGHIDNTEEFLKMEKEALGDMAPEVIGSSAADSASVTSPQASATSPTVNFTGGGGLDEPSRNSVDSGSQRNSFVNDLYNDDPAPARSSSQTQQVSVTGNEELEEFERKFPAIDVPDDDNTVNNVNTNGFGSAPQSTADAQVDYNQSSDLFSGQTPEPDSEAIREWREQQREEIKRRDEASEEKREATRAAAERAIDEFYTKYSDEKKENIKRNKEEEAEARKQREEWLSKGTSWERICDLVDLKDSRSKTNTRSARDIGRFKEALLSLKREGETAPSATGY